MKKIEISLVSVKYQSNPRIGLSTQPHYSKLKHADHSGN